MKVIDTDLSEVKLIQPDVHVDARGSFFEAYRESALRELGLAAFVQDNVSYSKQNVVRGLHYQLAPGQAKLVRALRGTIFDVAVDIRAGSSTFGQWIGAELSAENCHQLFIPAGFAHGFSVLSESACVYYKCSEYYDAPSEQGIYHADEALGIDWKVEKAVLSEKDAALLPLESIALSALPVTR